MILNTQGWWPSQMKMESSDVRCHHRSYLKTNIVSIAITYANILDLMVGEIRLFVSTVTNLFYVTTSPLIKDSVKSALHFSKHEDIPWHQLTL